MRPTLSLIPLSLLSLLATACASTDPTPPPDAQLVTVSVGAVITVDPAVVEVGDIWLVLDEGTTSVVFVEATATADAVPGPLTDDGLARLASGDTQGTSLQGFENFACNDADRAADRGELKVPGGCGNVFWVPGLKAGKYALIATDPTAQPGGGPIAIGVLEVRP